MKQDMFRNVYFDQNIVCVNADLMWIFKKDRLVKIRVEDQNSACHFFFSEHSGCFLLLAHTSSILP